ncbi:flavoprotein [Salinispora oceanensis]|uniref:flavoprotein n=1 Tax=Salinispora oceanensis TaxID=1050199 RepID=UPI000362416A|nr:flavoprotein [Salinispora oceanensis]
MSVDAPLATSQPTGGDRRVLYVLACGSPLARRVGRLVELAQQAGWEVCVVTTPDGARFVDRPALVRQTGYPVRSHYKNPGDPDVLPPADAMIVCPATVNTVTKWAVGMADTLPLGLLVEAQGRGVPLVAVPFTNAAMAAHPAFQAALGRLSEWGVTVLFGDHVVPLHPPGSGERHLTAFPWEAVVAALPAPSAATTVA